MIHLKGCLFGSPSYFSASALYRPARCNDKTTLHYCCRYGLGSRVKYGYGRTEKTSSHEVATVSTCATSSMAPKQSNIQGIRGA